MTSCVKPIFFFHLPKAAGTSIASALAGLFDHGDVAPLIENNAADHRRNAGDYRRFAGYRLYCGHYGSDVYEAICPAFRTIANFRHPVHRIRSLYRYFNWVPFSQEQLGEPQHAAVAAAKRLSLREFITSKDEAVLTYISNQHARQLTNSLWRLDPDVDLDKALARIDEMTALFLCEEPEASLGWLADALAIDTLPSLNRTPLPVAGEEDVLADEMICEINRLDLALYDHAVSRLRERPFRER